MPAHQAVDLESLNPVLIDRLQIETFQAETGIALPADYGDFITISTAHSAGHSGKVENP